MTRKKKIILLLAVAAAVLLGSVGLARLTEHLELGSFSSGTVYMCVESGFGDHWSLRYRRASDGYTKYRTMTLNEGEKLSAKVSCTAGTLELYLRQGDVEEKLVFAPDAEPVTVPLDGFDEGKLRLQLVSRGAENVESRFELVKED